MAQMTIPTDVLVNGNLQAKTMSVPAGAVGDSQVEADAGLAASKLEHQHQKEYAQAGAGNAAVERKVVHIVRGTTAGVVDFLAGARVAATVDATATIDLQKNGTSILSAAISLTAGTAAYALSAGTLAAGALTLVEDDVIEVVVSAVSAGGGALAKGLFAQVNIREEAQ